MDASVFRLDGQFALVTGGGAGLGLAISQAIVEAGARVMMIGRNEASLEHARDRLGARAHALVHDVTDLPSIPALVRDIEDRFGPLDILVNNAGQHLKKPAVDTSDEELVGVLATHVFGSYALSRECGRRMMEREHGSIVLVVSMAAIFGIPQVSAYTVAKAGLLGLTRALATEFSPRGVRVNAIAPGWIDTAMTRRAHQDDPARRARILDRTPLGRLGEPSDVGYAAVYLCSPAARFITGIVLPVDGGASIGF
ncbi:MAG: 3-oxoacyl-ACP reductase [Gammaproteobacteria bacterium RBG_16_66_13]|nr:MAG: 3-oxoacyl-ACP reductase [Gammaproteobacteria bacterium RBG_16_66_13]